MARTNNLTNFLNDVATAIKSKLGDNTPIPASQFDTKIGEIETVGTYQSKTLNISANGSQTITPDTGYDALSSVVINVQVPVKQLQSKTYEFTENTHIVLSPETGYDGFSSIDLTINVPSSGGIQEFASVEELEQAELSVNDKAIVYNNNDKLVGYYQQASKNVLMFPKYTDCTINNTNNTVVYNYDNAKYIPMLDADTFKTNILNILIEADWLKSPSTGWSFLSAGVLFMPDTNNTIHAYTLERTYNSNVYSGLPNLIIRDGNAYIGSGGLASGNSITIKHMIIDLSTFTYELKANLSVSRQNYNGGNNYQWISSTKMDYIPWALFVSKIGTATTYNTSLQSPSIAKFVSSSDTTVTSYTVTSGTNPDTKVVPELIDTGLIYGSRDGTATMGDIFKNKIAYVNGQKIIGTYDPSGSIAKLFETEQAMQADTDMHEGDMACVYRTELNNIQEDTVFSSCVLPASVTLPNTISSSVNAYFRPIDTSYMADLQVQLSSSSCRISYYGSSSYQNITYTSSDGKNYTRSTDVSSLNFGTDMQRENYGSWNDAIGYFIQANIKYFGGLYRNEVIEDTDYTEIYNGLDTSTKQYTTIPFKIPDITTYQAINERSGRTIGKLDGNLILLPTEYHLNDTEEYYIIDKCVVFQKDTYDGYIYEYYNETTNKFYVGVWYQASSSASNYPVFMDTYDFTQTEPLVSRQIQNINELTICTEPICKMNDTTLIYGKEITSNIVIRPSSNGYWKVPYFDITATNSSLVTNITVGNARYIFYKNYYLPAPSQLNLKEANQLLPGKSGYGANGIVEGDGSIYDNLDYPSMLSKINVDTSSFTKIINRTGTAFEFYTITDTGYTHIMPKMKSVINVDTMNPREIIQLTNGHYIGFYNTRINDTGSNRELHKVIYDTDCTVLSDTVVYTNDNIINKFVILVRDDYIYVYVAAYDNSTARHIFYKFDKTDGTAINNVSLGNAKLNTSYMTHFTWFNGPLLYGENSQYTSAVGIINLNDDLSTRINTSVEITGGYAGSSGVFSGVELDGSYYFILRNSELLTKIIKITGTDVTSVDVTSLSLNSALLSDGTYLYGNNGTNTIRFDENINVVDDDLPLSSLQYCDYSTTIIEFTDYQNYITFSNKNHILYVCEDGVIKIYSTLFALMNDTYGYCNVNRLTNYVGYRNTYNTNIYICKNFVPIKAESLPTTNDIAMITFTNGSYMYSGYIKTSEYANITLSNNIEEVTNGESE